MANDPAPQPPWPPLQASGLQGPVKAAITSGSLSSVGDLLAQFLLKRHAEVCCSSSSPGLQSCLHHELRIARTTPAERCWHPGTTPPPPLHHPQSAGKEYVYDPSRTARMFGFGLCFYGPYQFLWYNLLDFVMPGRSFRNFLGKVGAAASAAGRGAPAPDVGPRGL
jgi:protein Mpv17